MSRKNEANPTNKQHKNNAVFRAVTYLGVGWNLYVLVWFVSAPVLS